MKTVGEYIRAEREDRDLFAKELAKRAGISDGHIIYIEKGQRKPTFDVVMKILKALNVDVQEFLQETGYLPTNAEPAKIKKLRPVPIISWMVAGNWNEVSDIFQLEDAEDWIGADVKGKSVFALRVKGDSNPPGDAI